MKARSVSDYLTRRRPRYRLTAATPIDAPIDEVFAFFSRPENLGAITPSRMAFSITESSPRMGEGATIAYRLRVGGVPVQWRTQIERWAPGESFVDVQLEGPYHCWWHEHRFVAEGPSRTLMLDTVLYTPPMGLLGRIANRLMITGALRDIFAFRADAIRLRFGASHAKAPGGDLPPPVLDLPRVRSKTWRIHGPAPADAPRLDEPARPQASVSATQTTKWRIYDRAAVARSVLGR